jgi:hypothetical protein
MINIAVDKATFINAIGNAFLPPLPDVPVVPTCGVKLCGAGDYNKPVPIPVCTNEHFKLYGIELFKFYVTACGIDMHIDFSIKNILEMVTQNIITRKELASIQLQTLESYEKNLTLIRDVSAKGQVS